MSLAGTRRRRADRARLERTVALALLCVLAMITIYPLIWLFLNSLKRSDELFDASWDPPRIWHFANYATAWRYGLGHFMLNSVLVTAISVVAIVLFSALAAFVLVTIRFPGRWLVHAYILGGLIVPPEVTLFPLFKIMLVLGIYNTYGAMILPDIAYGLPFTVLLLRAYMTLIPHEMTEAATIDGAGMLRRFWSIYLPLSRPALAAAALIQGMRVWNEFVFALTFVSSDALRPLTVGLTTFGDSLHTDYSVLLAGLVISILPVLIVFLSMQRQFMGGLTAGALK
jgi:raffinose/stachyose/melibiose transport system permease protein